MTNMRKALDGFRQYRRSQIAELRPWQSGEEMARVSVSAPDREAGSPKAGDMIARNPKNHDDQWLVAAQYFADNFEPVAAPGGEPVAWRIEFTLGNTTVTSDEAEANDFAALGLLVEPLYRHPEAGEREGDRIWNEAVEACADWLIIKANDREGLDNADAMSNALRRPAATRQAGDPA